MTQLCPVKFASKQKGFQFQIRTCWLGWDPATNPGMPMAWVGSCGRGQVGPYLVPGELQTQLKDAAAMGTAHPTLPYQRLSEHHGLIPPAKSVSLQWPLVGTFLDLSGLHNSIPGELHRELGE